MNLLDKLYNLTIMYVYNNIKQRITNFYDIPSSLDNSMWDSYSQFLRPYSINVHMRIENKLKSYAFK